MISYEAVESGARVLIEDGQFGVPWEDAPEDDRAEVMARVRAILVAAAPHLEPREEEIREAMADGWDEAEQAQYVISLNPTGSAWEAIKANPYRATK